MAKKIVRKPLDDAVRRRVEGKIKRASELPQNQNFLIYGDPGVGKTRLSATAPDVLIVDINDLGTDSVRRDTDPRVYPVGSWNEVTDLYWYLQEGKHPFKSVAIDTVTGLQVLCMNFVLGEMSALDASRDPNMPSKQAWGKVGQLMRTQITNYRNLPMNTIFTAHVRAREVGDEEEDTTIVRGPEVSPSIAKHLQGAVGTIGYMVKREVTVRSKKNKDKIFTQIRRRLLVGDSEHYITKDRNGLFGDFIDAPDLGEMIEAIYSA